MVHAVVTGDGQKGRLAGEKLTGEVGFERGEPALVLGDELAVQPDLGRVGDGPEPQDHPLAGADAGSVMLR